MIRGYETIRHSEPEFQGGFQWTAALGAGLIAGAIFMIAPKGSPWSTLTFFSPIIMGRAATSLSSMPLIVVWFFHLLLSVVYGFVISLVISRLVYRHAVILGAFIGLILYFLNLGIVSLLSPDYRGSELTVLFTHIVGLIAAGAYRGLLRRRLVA